MAKTFEAYVTGEKVPESASAAALNESLKAIQADLRNWFGLKD
jgi:hypothetical protein